MSRPLILALALIGASLPANAGGVCSGDVWEVRGSVRDGQGQPARGTSVHVLLDRMSKKKFFERGVRARNTTVDANGRYRVGIDCGAYRAREDLPNPCAPKVREVTIIAGDRLRGFKLRDLEPVQRGTVCVVEVPELQLPKKVN